MQRPQQRHQYATGISYTKSTDGGRTFSPPSTIASFVDAAVIGDNTGIGNVRTNDFPMVATGPDGSIHVAYDAQPALLGPDRSDIFYVRSTDHGRTFSAPIRLNDDSTHTTQMLPSIAVTPAGAIGVRWWDRRNDPNFDSLTDVYMTISQDGGNTFGPNFRVSKQNFIYTPIEFGLAAGYHGDYDSMTADGENFLIPWSGEWRGDPDAYFAEVPANTNPLAPDLIVTSAKPLVSVVAGQSADSSIAVNAVGGLSGDITFGALTQIPGVTLTFNPGPPVPGLGVGMNIQTTSDTAPGSYLFAVTASNGGLTRGTSFWLNVLSAGASLATAPSNLSSTPGFTLQQSQQEVDADGNIHLCFFDDTDAVNFGFKVYYTKSTDGGLTFSTKQQLSAEGHISEDPILQINAGGNVYVIWQDSTYQLMDGAPKLGDVTAQMAVSKDGGQTFSTPITLPQAVLQLVSFNVANDGTLIFTYFAQAKQTSGKLELGNFELVAITSSDGGQTFSSPVRISQANQDLAGASVFADGKGSVLVAYQPSLGKNGFKEPVFSCISHDNGRTFSAPVQISPAKTTSFFALPVIALASDGSAYVLYQTLRLKPDPSNPGNVDLVDPNLYLSVAADGQTFTTAPAVSDLLASFTMTIDAHDNVLIAFPDFIESPGDQFSQPIVLIRSTDKGNSFSIPVFVSDPQSSPSPDVLDLAVDNNGVVSATWSDFNLSDNPDILFTRSTDGGVTFSTPLNVSNNPGSSDFPFLAILPDSSVSVLWTDDSYENDEIASAIFSAPVAAAPGFSLLSQFVTVPVGTNKLVVSVSRPGQFSGPVTVTAPSNPGPGITISPSSVVTTTSNATFTVTVKAPNTFNLNFVGADGSGASSTGVIALTAQ